MIAYNCINTALRTALLRARTWVLRCSSAGTFPIVSSNFVAILQHKTWTKKSLAVAVNREDSREKLEKFSQQNWIVARGVQRILEKTSFSYKKN